MCPASSHFLNILKLSHQILHGQTVSQKPDMPVFLIVHTRLSGRWQHVCVPWRALHTDSGLCSGFIQPLTPPHGAFRRFTWADKMIHLIDKTGWLLPSVSPRVSAYSCSWILLHVFIFPLHRYLRLFCSHSIQLHPRHSGGSTSFLPAPVYSSVFVFFSIPLCGFVCVSLFFSFAGDD